MYKFKMSDLPAVLTRWAEQYTVFVPCGTPENVQMRIWSATSCPIKPTPPDENDEHFLSPDEYINLSMSPKSFVFNEREPLFRWEGNEKTCVADSEPYTGRHDGDRILFGVRPCDVAGFSYMDRFFLGEHQDINYQLRRQHVFVVAVNCVQSGPRCFCSSFGAGPFAPSAEPSSPASRTSFRMESRDRTYDLLLTPDAAEDAHGESWYWVEAGSERGKTLLARAANWLHRDLEATGAARRRELESRALGTIARSVNADSLSGLLAAHFNDEIWESVASGCIGCTGCTRVCPTCTCFTTEEEHDAPHSGTRVRVWDSCQSVGFTRNAEWHNPRTRTSAVRYRIYDKLKYIGERFGLSGCTGCGRCTAVCPAGIDMLDLVSRFAAATPELAQAQSAAATPPTVHFDRQERLFDPQLYTPLVAEIIDIREEARGIKRFTVRYKDRPEQGSPALRGQFFMLTVFGVGESAISVPFSDRVRDGFSFYVKKAGTVTSAMHELKIGDVLGLRGPFGVPLPYETLKGRDLLVVGSGVGLAPVRATLVRAIENRQDFGRIVVMASATSYEGLLLKDDLENWSAIPGVEVFYSLSRPTDKVKAHVGYINDLLPDLGLDWKNTSAIVCASARRIKAVARDLMRLGLKPSDIYTTLETNMRCGVGKCGHCKVGAHYMCVDGPVFTYEEMLALPPEF